MPLHDLVRHFNINYGGNESLEAELEAHGFT
jgi:hypothetical protein